ncbi:MAG: TIM barrel protein [Gaiellaceae bacterium]
MSQLGANTWIWVSPFGDKDVGLARHAKELGFDVLEFAIEATAGLTAEVVRDACATVGIGASVCGAFGPDRDLSHEEESVRRHGIDYLKYCVDFAGAVGAPQVAGPMYSAVGKARMLPDEEREQQRRWAVESLREAAEYAEARGVRLAIEPLNRFETDLVNTAGQALELCERIGKDNVGVHLDTFHMNIEEKSLPDAIRTAGERLFHFHACENDRSAAGTGHVDWPGVFGALRDIGYEGQVVIESFTPAAKEIAKAVSMWRPLDLSGDELARKGLAFLREGLRSAPASVS